MLLGYGARVDEPAFRRLMVTLNLTQPGSGTLQSVLRILALAALCSSSSVVYPSVSSVPTALRVQVTLFKETKHCNTKISFKYSAGNWVQLGMPLHHVTRILAGEWGHDLGKPRQGY